jgi:hypothetical protein
MSPRAKAEGGKMIPAGPERDRRIAELRGDKCTQYSMTPIEFGTSGPACRYNSIAFPDDCRREGESYCLGYEDKPYSTDITTAMELWDEMVKDGLYPVLRTIEIDHGEIGYRMCAGEVYEGWSKADAISGCYLEWKEGR